MDALDFLSLHINKKTTLVKHITPPTNDTEGTAKSAESEINIKLQCDICQNYILSLLQERKKYSGTCMSFISHF